MTIKLLPKWKYRRPDAVGDRGSHNRNSNNSGKKKLKGAEKPNIRGGRVRAFN